jgi:AcrR family transcriptional regulator
MVGDDAMRAPRKKHSGRPAGNVNSQHRILEAARAEFRATGYAGTTTRSIAESAGVDAALIHHFFLSKGGLFTSAVQDVFGVPEVADAAGTSGPAESCEHLVRAYVAHWEEPAIQPRLIGLLRSATAYEGATAVIGEFLAGALLPLARAADSDRAELRASLSGSYLLGVAALRYVALDRSMASLSQDQLVRTVAPVCRSYLFDSL